MHVEVVRVQDVVGFGVDLLVDGEEGRDERVDVLAWLAVLLGGVVLVVLGIAAVPVDGRACAATDGYFWDSADGAAELLGRGVQVDAGGVGEAEGVDYVADLGWEGEEGEYLALWERPGRRSLAFLLCVNIV